MKITIDRNLLEQAIKKLHMLLLPVPAKETTAIMLAKRVSVQATEVCGLLQEALEQPQPQQEPVAWMHGWHDGEHMPPLHPHYSDPSEIDPPESVRPLVFGDTCPPARKPLTDDQWQAVSRNAREAFFGCKQDSVLGQIDCAAHAAMRATESAHGIKDTPC